MQLAGRVREHLEDVGLPPRPSSVARIRVGHARTRCSSSQTRCHFASIACGSYRSMLLSFGPGTKKPLDREARGRRRGSAAFAPWLRRSCCHCCHRSSRQHDRRPAPVASGRAPALPRFGLDRRRASSTIGGVAAGELAERFGTPLVVYCEQTLRARARAFRAAVGRRTRRLRHEGVPERRGAAPARARRGSAPTSRRSASSRSPRRPGSRARSSSCTATTRTRRCSARPPRPARTVVLDAPDEAALAARPACAARSSA